MYGRKGPTGSRYLEKAFTLPPKLTCREACELIAKERKAGDRRPTRDDMVNLARTALRTEKP
jgi:hypothetical protein